MRGAEGGEDAGVELHHPHGDQREDDHGREDFAPDQIIHRSLNAD